MDKITFKDVREVKPLSTYNSKLELFNVRLNTENEDEYKYAIVDKDGNVIYRHSVKFATPYIHFDKFIELDSFGRNNELIDLNGKSILKSNDILVRGKLAYDGNKVINLLTLANLDADASKRDNFGYSSASKCHFIKKANYLNIYDENLNFLYAIDLLSFGNYANIFFNGHFIILDCGNEKKAIIFEKDNCKIIDDFRECKYRHFYNENILVYVSSNQLIIYDFVKKRNIRVFDNVDSPIYHNWGDFLYFTCANNYTYIVNVKTGKILKTFKVRIVPSFGCDRCTISGRENMEYHGNLLLVRNGPYNYNLLFMTANALLLKESIHHIGSAYRNNNGWSFQVDSKHSFAVKDYFFHDWYIRNEDNENNGNCLPLTVKGKNLIFGSKVIY